jgi:hypothetical protein
MNRLESDLYKHTHDNLKLTEDVTFRTSPAFKSELEQISEEYKIPLSEMCRLALIRLVKQEARAAAGDIE